MISLTDYLIKKYSYTKSRIKKLYKYKEVYVNDKLVKMDTLINDNDKIEIKKTKEVLLNNNKKLDIIYEDKNYLVVNKPSGLLTVATDKEKENTLYHEVREYIKSINKKNYIYIVHRLDKDTSGIVIFAKNEKVKKELQNNWNKLVKERKYVAVVEGKLPKEKDRLENYLKETSTNHVYVVNYKTDTLAITNYEVVSSNNKYSKLNITIETGKKNQIRSQLANIGNPIVGDKKYSENYKGIKRLMLHACRLVFTDPISRKEMVFETSIPKEFNKLINDKK